MSLRPKVKLQSHIRKILTILITKKIQEIKLWHKINLAKQTLSLAERALKKYKDLQRNRTEQRVEEGLKTNFFYGTHTRCDGHCKGGQPERRIHQKLHC